MMMQNREQDTRPPLPGAGQMEDYTNAFLVSFGVLVFMVLCAIWAWIGLPLTLVAVYLVNRFVLSR